MLAEAVTVIVTAIRIFQYTICSLLSNLNLSEQHLILEQLGSTRTL